jgi:hypothetical protein
MRARRRFHPAGDARSAPQSAPRGLRRADPLRTTNTSTKLLSRTRATLPREILFVDPGASVIRARPEIHTAATAPAPRFRAGAEHRPGKTPHPEN